MRKRIPVAAREKGDVTSSAAEEFSDGNWPEGPLIAARLPPPDPSAAVPPVAALALPDGVLPALGIIGGNG